MTLDYENFEAGLWGSFPTTANGGGNELDAYLSYDFGPFALTLTNLLFLVMEELILTVNMVSLTVIMPK